MYTILINKDKTLTTSIRTPLLYHSTTDQIQILLDDNIESEEEFDSSLYSATLEYETNKVIKTEELIVDSTLYKGKVRFITFKNSALFNNRGEMVIWLIVNKRTPISTIDETTGEETITYETTSFNTLTTTLFIEDISHTNCRRADNNTIFVTRGDSLVIGISLTDDEGYKYEPVEGDVAYFRVKKAATSDTVLIEKEVDLENSTISLVENDTKNLAFGEYKYEVELITTTNDHYTVIKNAPFIIGEELH